MKTRAIKDLCMRKDIELFEECEQGLALCSSNAEQLHAGWQALSSAGHRQAAEVLRLAAEEEAAKTTILLDAIRCPRSNKDGFSRQLGYFNDHLAKGIYAEYFWTKPDTFGRVRRWVNLERKELYLDGPNDVDWVFPNNLLWRRENAVYVDYVESEGDHSWWAPRQVESLLEVPSRILELMVALKTAGCFSKHALSLIAQVWRSQQIDDDFEWDTMRKLNMEVLALMERDSAIVVLTPQSLHLIVEDWLFPLYPLDLRKERVKEEDLRAIQQKWTP